MNDDLLVKYLLNTTTSAENTQVEAWLREKDENRRYYEHFQLIWKESRQLAATSTVDENEAWKRFQKRVGADDNTAKIIPITPAKQNGFAPLLRIAAIIVVLLGAGTLWLLLRDQKTVISASQLAVNSTLPDGSSITLNKDSKLTYASAKNVREVALTGEAFFDVAKDVNKPFIIKVNDITIKVLGTSFNVKNHNNTTSVIVESGAVEVSRGNEVLQLKQNERAIIDARQSIQKQSSTDELYNYYRTQSFVCNNTPLWQLVELMNEVYGTNIIIADSTKRDIEINSTFSTKSLDETLRVIGLTYQIEVTKTNSQILLK
ncbi:DUF4974 domain-containing protein [Chitinophaga silvatica]|uniref:DUF4974 domain-containing protein n=1 Tax=Chitinophaga silvatica TaxID=2282649 RepID=A0A3E1Y4W7_9BACT|nr:FecR domain-containing protein [Chitinophaga silvatica]RFS19703.1 DUF4974 domain-containing protein [Chitinophaga silvatica]